MIAFFLAAIDVLALVAGATIWALRWRRAERVGIDPNPYRPTTERVGVACVALLAVVVLSWCALDLSAGDYTTAAIKAAATIVLGAIALITNGHLSDEVLPYWTAPMNSIEVLFLVVIGTLFAFAFTLREGFAAL